jgi:SulP family sulfate permease
VFSAAAVAATVLLFAPLARFIPSSSLAGLLMLAAFRMVDREQLVFHLRATRFDAGVVLATALSAVFISVEFCIVIGVFLSFVLYVPRAAQVRMAQLTAMPDGRIRERQVGDAACDRLLCYAVEGEVFFGADPELGRLLDAVGQAAGGPVRVVLLVLRRARNPDAAFLKLLRAFHGRLRQRDVALVLCGVQADLRRALADTGLDACIGARRIFYDGPDHDSSTGDAVHFSYRLLGPGVCPPSPRSHESACTARPSDSAI